MNTTRRTVLKGGAAIAALGAPLAAISLTGTFPSSAAIQAVPVPIGRATVEPLLEIEREWLAWLDCCNNDPNESDQAIDARCAHLFEIEQRIIDTPARTPAGIAVKLRLFAHYEKPAGEFCIGNWELMTTALHDAERLAGRA